MKFRELRQEIVLPLQCAEGHILGIHISAFVHAAEKFLNLTGDAFGKGHNGGVFCQEEFTHDIDVCHILEGFTFAA